MELGRGTFQTEAAKWAKEWMCEITSHLWEPKCRVGRMGMGVERFEVGQVNRNLISGTFSFFCFVLLHHRVGFSSERCWRWWRVSIQDMTWSGSLFVGFISCGVKCHGFLRKRKILHHLIREKPQEEKASQWEKRIPTSSRKCFASDSIPFTLLVRTVSKQ